MTSTAGIRVVLAGAEEDVLADGEGARIQRFGGLTRSAVVMQTNIAEITADVAFQIVAHRRIQALGGPFAHLLDRLLDRGRGCATLGTGAGGGRGTVATGRCCGTAACWLRCGRAVRARRSARIVGRCVRLARALHWRRRCRLRFWLRLWFRRLRFDRSWWCGLGGLGPAATWAQLRTRFGRRGLFVVGLFGC